MNVAAEELNQFLSFLILIFNKSETCQNIIFLLSAEFKYLIQPCLIPCCCSFSKELHKTSLHHQPKASWHVEDNSQEYEVKWYPLVVTIIHYRVVTVILKSIPINIFLNFFLLQINLIPVPGILVKENYIFWVND